MWKAACLVLDGFDVKVPGYVKRMDKAKGSVCLHSSSLHFLGLFAAVVRDESISFTSRDVSILTELLDRIAFGGGHVPAAVYNHRASKFVLEFGDGEECWDSHGFSCGGEICARQTSCRK